MPLILTSKPVKSLNRVRLFVIPQTPLSAHQAPPSVGFSRHESWSGLPFPSLGDLPDPGIEPVSPTLQADALLSETPGMPTDSKNHHYFISPWGSLACTAVHWGRKEPDTTEMLNTTRQRSNHDSSQKVPLREPRSSNFKWKEAVEAFKLRKYKNRFKACVHAKLLQSCPTLWHPMDCNPRFLCP